MSNSLELKEDLSEHAPTDVLEQPPQCLAVKNEPQGGCRQRLADGDTWLTPGRFTLLLSLLVLAMFPATLFGRETFVFRDFGLFSYPVAFFQRACFWHGELPLWNPYSLCGVPFLAQWNTLTLYPPSLIYLLLPLAWSLSFFCVLHLVWAGLGMYCLARHWTGQNLAAGLAGIIFAFNGLILNLLMWPSHVATMSWLPWVLWLVPRAWEQGGRALVWAVLAASMQMLAGGPETILTTWLILLTLLPGTCWRAAGKRALVLRRFMGVGLLVSMLCAVQLGPFLELVAHSQRDSDYGALARNWSLPSSGWANLLVPLFGTEPTPQGVYLQKDQYWTSSYYVGIGTVLLAILAAVRVRNWRVRLLAVWLLAGLLLALGDHGGLYWLLIKVCPWVSAFRYPAKFMICVVAVVPLLAAFGIRHLQETRRWSALEWSIVGIALVLIGVIVAFQWKLEASNWQAVFHNGLARATFLVTICVLLSLWRVAGPPAGPNAREASSTSPGFYVLRIARHSSLMPPLFGCLFLVTFWLDFLTHVPNQNPAASPAIYTPGWAKAQLAFSLEPKLGESRALISPTAQTGLKYHSIADSGKMYLLDRLGLLANCNLLDQIPQAHGFFSLVPGEIGDATSAPYVLTNRDFSPLLDFMGVTQITAPGETFKWTTRASALPFINAGQQPSFADDRNAFAAFSDANTDLRQIAFLPPEAKPAVQVTREPSAQATKLEVANQVIRFQVETPAACLATIAQTYYPCWRAYVDGQPTKLWRANYAFQAVVVPAGTHRVELRYRDIFFEAGVVLSLVGFAGCLYLWVRHKHLTDGAPV